MIAGQPATFDEALSAAAVLLKSKIENQKCAVVGSGRSSVEEQFLTRKLAAALQAPAWIVARAGEGDKLLISADRNPNTRAAMIQELRSVASLCDGVRCDMAMLLG